VQIVEVANRDPLERGADLLGDHLDGIERPHVEDLELEVAEVRLRLHGARHDGQSRALS
jgi:hypothetical protein